MKKLDELRTKPEDGDGRLYYPKPLPWDWRQGTAGNPPHWPYFSGARD